MPITKAEAKKRIEKLKELINHHRYLYHVLDKQEISDAALDSLKKELFDLEQKFPQFITPDSPSQRIGGKPLEKFEKVKHPKPMLSFNDAFSQKEMIAWLERISKLLSLEERQKIDFFCEPKLDGLAIELIYKNGILKIGSTRGDGLIGEDVTQNLRTIEAIPLKLKESKDIVVRGEVVISKKNFEEINQAQIRKNLTPFANPRNLAAGSIRQLDPKIAAERKLDATVYDIISDFNQETHQQEHKILEDLGFKTNNKYSRYCQNLNEVFEFHNFLYQNRAKLPYEIDGVVVTINNNKIFEKLGVVGKSPRAAIAYKFPLKQATTIIEDIKIYVGRTGTLTPVACLKPVQVGGVTISRATLHNEDEIKKLGVRVGDTVIVGRAGDVIPDIIKVLPELRTGKEKEFKMPEKCPSCSSKIIRDKEGVISRCSNPKCFAQQKRYFEYFISKAAFNIVGLGPKIVNQLIEQGLVSDPSDLFKLKEGDLISLERFGEKKAKNIIEAIQKVKKITLSHFIYALGIRNVGEETAELLADHFGTIENLRKASLEDFQELRDIGPVVAKSIYEYFQKKRNLQFLEKLKKVGIEIIPTQKSKVKSQKLKGLIFVLTGALETMTRQEAKEKIRSLGGETSESISKKTDYLVVAKEPGSKLEKAKKLGIKILTEKEFLSFLNN